MKAPDKIYLWENPIINGGYDPAWHINSLDVADIEYIRKDMLLKWAENNLRKYDSHYTSGGKLMEEFIDKINSL